MKKIFVLLLTLALSSVFVPQSKAQETARLNIYFSNDFNGYLEPCG
ncbi:hypothetical protein JW935_11715 [candidate division KSB1 bacterium]|nr:hypothetical protein [candidate division KSB1 bacterium]